MSILGELFGVPGDEWVQEAVCATADPEAWFPLAWNQGKEAKSICMSCPVRSECLRYATDNDERWGIFGAFSESDRDKLRRGQNPVSSYRRTHRQANGHGFNCHCPLCRGAA